MLKESRYNSIFYTAPEIPKVKIIEDNSTILNNYQHIRNLKNEFIFHAKMATILLLISLSSPNSCFLLQYQSYNDMVFKIKRSLINK